MIRSSASMLGDLLLSGLTAFENLPVGILVYLRNIMGHKIGGAFSERLIYFSRQQRFLPRPVGLEVLGVGLTYLLSRKVGETFEI